MSHSEATYLEVLTAQQSQLSARLLQIADRFEGIQGMISLYRALGGGSEEPNVAEDKCCSKRCKKSKKQNKK
jgi:outer membrane protein TolC